MKPGNRSIYDCGANSSKAMALEDKRGAYENLSA